MFEIRKIAEHEYPSIQRLIHTTVKTCYPAIYPPEVIEFFIQHHSLEEISRRAISGVVLVLVSEGFILATGFLADGELGGVYVHPDYQRQGLGTLIVKRLLEIACREKLNSIWLDATPIAKPMYDKLGFELISNMVQYVGDVPLHYFKMEKIL